MAAQTVLTKLVPHTAQMGTARRKGTVFNANRNFIYILYIKYKDLKEPIRQESFSKKDISILTGSRKSRTNYFTWLWNRRGKIEKTIVQTAIGKNVKECDNKSATQEQVVTLKTN